MVPTIHDVATRAGVSISTVSRVLNRSASVNEDKQARVRAAAEALGYSPNPVALTLLGQRTGGIGVLLPFIAGDFFSEFLRGIDAYTRDRGLFLMASSTHRNLKEFKAVLRGAHHRVDGLIVMSPEIPAATVCEWLPPALPVVFANTDATGTDVTAFNFDNRHGARAITEHLLDQGHERIAFIQGPKGAHDAAERRAGFREALVARDLEPALEVPGEFSMESGEAAVAELLAADPRPTAVFAANDDSAFGVLTGLRAAGVQVPEHMAVAGFDDGKLAQLAVPSLTTVHVPDREMGRAAIEALCAWIDGENDGSQGVTVFPTEVVVRQSTAPTLSAS